MADPDTGIVPCRDCGQGPTRKHPRAGDREIYLCACPMFGYGWDNGRRFEFCFQICPVCAFMRDDCNCVCTVCGHYGCSCGCGEASSLPFPYSPYTIPQELRDRMTEAWLRGGAEEFFQDCEFPSD